MAGSSDEDVDRGPGVTVTPSQDMPEIARHRFMVWLIGNGIDVDAIPPDQPIVIRGDRITYVEVLKGGDGEWLRSPFSHRRLVIAEQTVPLQQPLPAAPWPYDATD